MCVCKSRRQRPFLSADLALDLLLVPPRRDGVQEGTGRRGAAGGRASHSKACRSSRFCSQDSSLLRALQEVRAQRLVTGDTDVFGSRARPCVSPSVSLPSDCPVFGAVQGPRAWVQASETQAAEGGTVGLCPCTRAAEEVSVSWRSRGGGDRGTVRGAEVRTPHPGQREQGQHGGPGPAGRGGARETLRLFTSWKEPADTSQSGGIKTSRCLVQLRGRMMLRHAHARTHGCTVGDRHAHTCSVGSCHSCTHTRTHAHSGWITSTDTRLTIVHTRSGTCTVDGCRAHTRVLTGCARPAARCAFVPYRTCAHRREAAAGSAETPPRPESIHHSAARSQIAHCTAPGAPSIR